MMTSLALTLVGPDRPGLVSAVARRAEPGVPANVSLDVLRGDLDVLANELVVDLSLNERG
jgi:glycine cleavage system regulatory protein